MSHEHMVLFMIMALRNSVTYLWKEGMMQYSKSSNTSSDDAINIAYVAIQWVILVETLSYLKSEQQEEEEEEEEHETVKTKKAPPPGGA